jgi:RND family efflux transporter MFP subunit
MGTKSLPFRSAVRRARPVRALGAAAWLAVAISAALPADAASPAVVPTAVVQAAGSAAGFQIDGSLQPLRQSTLAAQVGGNVLVLAVKAGDRVKAGQLIARIDERSAQAGLAQSEAGVAQAEATLRNARLHAERTRELRAQGFISQAAVDVAESQLAAAQAGLQQAQAGRSQAALSRGFASVTAPFDAVVLATHVEAGDLATPGRPLVTVYAPGEMRAVVQLPASRSAAARAAPAIEIELPDGRRVAPARRTDLPTADPVSQTVEWRLDLAREDVAGLLPGQNVRVFFAGAATASAAPSRLTVPTAAVLRRGELTAVYAAQQGQFVLKAVRLGTAQAGAVEVLAGLKPGERVALDPVRAGLAGATPAP